MLLDLPVLFALLLAFPLAFSARISFNQVKRPTGLHRRSGLSSVSLLAAADDADGLDLTTVHDLIYIANVTVGNTEYPVQLDTGSSDVWIKGASSPLPNCTDTDTVANLTYGIGWVYGHISYGPVEFAGIKVSSQAFLDVSSANNPALSYGADGLVGLGFTSLSSIDHSVNATGASTGRSLLYNMFLDNPSEPNYIAFALQRSTDSGNDVQGSFSIGEVEPAYSAVLDAPAIPTWPISFPSRWNVLLEALLVNNGSGTTVVTPTTNVTSAPSNRAVVLLDSGTSYTYAPAAICDAIYSGVPGAQYSPALGQWTVPCDQEVDIALQFAGKVYPIHPLDVTPNSLTNVTQCVGAFVPQSVSVGAGEFDWLIGDNVLRSMYSIYDFGDFDSSNKMGDPYVKLLSLVDPNEASKDFHATRGGTAANNITYNVANSTAAASGSVTVSSDISHSLDQIVALVPAMLGIMALNAVVLLALGIFGIMYMCRKRKTKSTARKNRGRMSPMPMSLRNSYVAGPEPQAHVYEPVSMAITEDLGMRPMSMNPRDSFAAGVPMADRAPVSMAISEDMFQPPSPATRTFKSSGLRPIERPDSAAYQRQPSMAVSEDQLFAPPSPGFRSFDGKPGDRPRSANYQRQPSEDSLVAPAHSFDDSRPRSASFQRSPSEEDSVFVASPMTIAQDPVFVPPPPQRQAPPPPLRPPPQRSPPPLPPSSDPPQPHRQSSRDSLAPSLRSVQLTDDQFATPNPGPGPTPRPRRQPSNNSSLFVPREFTGQPGDRPQSFAPAEGFMPLAAPSPAFHSDGGRPKSMA